MNRSQHKQQLAADKQKGGEVHNIIYFRKPKEIKRKASRLPTSSKKSTAISKKEKNWKQASRHVKKSK